MNFEDLLFWLPLFEFQHVTADAESATGEYLCYSRTSLSALTLNSFIDRIRSWSWLSRGCNSSLMPCRSCCKASIFCIADLTWSVTGMSNVVTGAAYRSSSTLLVFIRDRPQARTGVIPIPPPLYYRLAVVTTRMSLTTYFPPTRIPHPALLGFKAKQCVMLSLGVTFVITRFASFTSSMRIACSAAWPIINCRRALGSDIWNNKSFSLWTNSRISERLHRGLARLYHILYRVHRYWIASPVL